MAKDRKPRDPDPNVTAKGMIDRLAARADGQDVPEPPDEPREPKKDPAAVELGRRGGLKGGKARADKLTAERRSAIARNAAKARWEKHQDSNESESQ